MAKQPLRLPEAPSLIGHVLAAMLGVASIAAGIGALMKDLPGVMSYTLLIVGFTLPALVALSLMRSRAAWSFVISICGVFALVTLFGAPKICALLGVPLAASFLLPFLYTTVVVLLATSASDYTDQGVGTARR